MESANLEALQIAEQLLILSQRKPHLRGYLAFAWRITSACRKCPYCLFHRSAFTAQLARTPVQCSQAVKDRSPDTELRVASKLHLFGWIELGERVHQSNHASRDQVFNVHMLRKPFVNAAGKKTHDRQVLEKHPLLLAVE